MSYKNKSWLSAVAAGMWIAASLSLPAGAQENDRKVNQPETAAPTLSVGDPAPPLKVEKFIKGEPVKEFKPGHVYVVEFWATWCGPCRVTMPHLTELQKKFQGKATFIGVNIWEDRPYNDQTLAKVEEFVKNNSEKMGYTVAYDGPDKRTDQAYMGAAGERGIPSAFVITPDGKIGYIGHPEDEGFEVTIQKLLDGKFDMKEAIAAAKERKAQEEAFLKNREKYLQLIREANKLLDEDKIDEGLAKTEEAYKLMPGIDASQIEMQKFAMLMQARKYERAYGIAARLVEGPAKDNAMLLNAIAWSMVDPDAGIEKPEVDLALKAAAQAVKLTDSKDAAIVDTLARCYWLKGDKAKAIELQTQAVELSKDDPEMKASLQKTLDEYKK